jgi:hypothetical protein
MCFILLAIRLFIQTTPWPWTFVVLGHSVIPGQWLSSSFLVVIIPISFSVSVTMGYHNRGHGCSLFKPDG